MNYKRISIALLVVLVGIAALFYNYKVIHIGNAKLIVQLQLGFIRIFNPYIKMLYMLLE